MPNLGTSIRRAAAVLVLALAAVSSAAPPPAIADLEQAVNDAIAALGTPENRAQRRLLDRLQRAREALAVPAQTVQELVAAALAASTRIPAATRSSPEVAAALAVAVTTFLVDADPAVSNLQAAVEALGLPASRVRRVASQLDAARRQLERARDEAAPASDRLRATAAVFDRVQRAQDRLDALLQQMANAACDEPGRLGMEQHGTATVSVTGRTSPVVISGTASGDGLGNTSAGDFNGTLSQGGREISFHFMQRGFSPGVVPWQQFLAEFSFYENGTNYRATSGEFRITSISNRRYAFVPPGPGVVSRYVTIGAVFTGTVQNSGDPTDTLEIRAEFRFCEIPYYYLP